MQVNERLGEYLKNKGISQNQVGKEIGVSSATISQFLAGKYSGDVKALGRKVLDWLDRQEERGKDLTIPTIETKNYGVIHRVCGLVHKNKDMGLIAGPAGVGKTYALEQYGKENSNVILIKVDSTYNRQTLLQEIAKLTQSKIKGDFRMIFDNILEVLSNRDYLLIIDEADQLKHNCLELVRNIHDKTKTGVVLVGILDLIGKIKGNYNDHQQLESRLGVQMQLKYLGKEDMEAVANGSGVDIEKSITKTISTFAKGSIRTLTKLINRCYETMTANNKNKIDMETCEMGMSLMGGAI
jgi:DNA transposition AAA+ family ATPase